MNGYLEDLCHELESQNMITILDKNLESVIAEAAKLQHKVLESIIGDKNEEVGATDGHTDEAGESVDMTREMEIMRAAEKQLKIHKSEKETFSKGIASIIYNKMEVNEENLAIDEGYDDDGKQELEYSEDKNNIIEEIEIERENIEVVHEARSETVKVSISNLSIL